MLSTVCEFIPQMIFLNAIFGYLCVLITVKWLTASYADLYNVLIRMFLGLGDVLPANQVSRPDRLSWFKVKGPSVCVSRYS